MTFRLLLVLLLVSATLACDPSRTGTGNNASATQSPTSSGGLAVPLEQSAKDVRIFPPNPAPSPNAIVPCPLGTFDLTKQKVEPPSPGVTGTLTIGEGGPTAELAAGEMKISVNVPDSTKYSAIVRMLDKDCKPRQDIPVTVSFGLTYRAIVETSSSEAFTCIFRSRADYSSFSITVGGSSTLGEAVKLAMEKRIKEDVLKNLDFGTAEAVNKKFRSNASLPGGVDGRCDWKELDPDGVRR